MAINRGKVFGPIFVSSFYLALFCLIGQIILIFLRLFKVGLVPSMDWLTFFSPALSGLGLFALVGMMLIIDLLIFSFQSRKDDNPPDV